MEIEKQRENALGECSNAGVIDEAADEVARSILAGHSIEVAFAPGNGGRYCWLFVPMESADHVDLGGMLESPSTSEGGVWVGDLIRAGTLYPLVLIRRSDRVPHPSYIAEKWFGGGDVFTSDVFILERLFAGIIERTRLAAV